MRPKPATVVPLTAEIAMPHFKEIFCQKQTQFGFREDKF
jgi:hypothetical protein